VCETFNYINFFFLVQVEKAESKFLDIYDAKVVFFDYGKNKYTLTFKNVFQMYACFYIVTK